MSPSTSSRRCPLLLLPLPWRSPMSCPTVRSSPSVTRGSGALRLSSSLPSLEWRPVVSMRPPTTTSGRTCTPTLSCLVAPPCTLVLLTVCRRRSLPSLPPPSRSRSLPHLRGSTLSGSEDPSCLPCPPSSRCGSPSRSTTSAAHPLSTGSASKCFHPKTITCSNKYPILPCDMQIENVQKMFTSHLEQEYTTNIQHLDQKMFVCYLTNEES